MALFAIYSRLFSQNSTNMNFPADPTKITCITKASNGDIYVGTNLQGLWRYANNAWTKCPQISSIIAHTNAGNGNFDFDTRKINDLGADQNGGIWVAQSGINTTSCSGGNVVHLPNGFSSAILYFPVTPNNYQPLNANGGIPSLNVQTIDVGLNNDVWSGHSYNQTYVTGYDTFDPITGFPVYVPGYWLYHAGGVAKKTITIPGVFSNLSGSLPQGTAWNPNVWNNTGDVRIVLSIAVGPQEVWVARNKDIQGNLVPAQIVRYNHSGAVIGTYQETNTPLPMGTPTTSLKRPLAVHFDKNGNGWCGLAGNASNGWGGIGVLKNGGTWKYHKYTSLPLSSSITSVYPKDANVNPHAIWSDSTGRVFIGTTKGLVVYGGEGDLGNTHSYTLYTTAENCLLADNVIGGVSGSNGYQWIATSSGIMKTKLAYYPLQPIGYQSCNNAAINLIESNTMQYTGGNMDYHYYKVSTEICSQTTGNYASNCTADHVFNMMKNDVTLTTPVPSAFMGAYTPNPIIGGVGGLFLPVLGTILFEQAQLSTNLPNVQSCQEYSLYNNYNLSLGRTLMYRLKSIANSVTNICPNVLQNVVVDKVRVYPDNQNKTITNYTMPGHALYPGKVTRYVIEECGKVKIVTIGIGLNNCGSNAAGYILGVSNIVLGSDAFKKIDIKLKAAFDSGI